MFHSQSATSSVLNRPNEPAAISLADGHFRAASSRPGSAASSTAGLQPPRWHCAAVPIRCRSLFRNPTVKLIGITSESATCETAGSPISGSDFKTIESDPSRTSDILPAIQKRNGVDLNSGRAEERKFPMRYFRKVFDEARMVRLTRSTSRNTRSRFPPRILWMSSDE